MKIRMYYGEKIKNKKMLNYFIGYLNGLNGCYLNFKSDEIILYGPKMKCEIESLNLSIDESRK